MYKNGSSIVNTIFLRRPENVQNCIFRCVKHVRYQHGISYEHRLNMESTLSYAHMNKNGSNVFLEISGDDLNDLFGLGFELRIFIDI